MKVTVVGIGSVGRLISFQLAISGVVNEMIMVDINRDRAEAEVLDICHSLPFYNSYCEIKAASDYASCGNSDFIILTASIPFPVKRDKAGNLVSASRDEMADENIALYSKLMNELYEVSPDSFYLVVANPNDVLVRLIDETTPIGRNKIIGTGTSIDTARVLSILTRNKQRQYHFPELFVVGEHSDQQFIPKDYSDLFDKLTEREVLATALQETREVFMNKNFSTNCAISSVCLTIVKAIASDSHTIFPLSSYFNFGNTLEGYLSMPRILTKEGIARTLRPKLAEDEITVIQRSIESINKYSMTGHINK